LALQHLYDDRSLWAYQSLEELTTQDVAENFCFNSQNSFRIKGLALLINQLAWVIRYWVKHRFRSRDAQNLHFRCYSNHATILAL